MEERTPPGEVKVADIGTTVLRNGSRIFKENEHRTFKKTKPTGSGAGGKNERQRRRVGVGM